MKTLLNQHGTCDDVRFTLICNEHSYTRNDLWQALRNERKSKNRKTVVKMLRQALRRNMRRVAALAILIISLGACTVPGKLTQGELEALAAYDRAQYREVTVQQRIYYLDSTTVWTPCGEGWYCRSREIEQYMDDPALKPFKKPIKQ